MFKIDHMEQDKCKKIYLQECNKNIQIKEQRKPVTLQKKIIKVLYHLKEKQMKKANGPQQAVNVKGKSLLLLQMIIPGTIYIIKFLMIENKMLPIKNSQYLRQLSKHCIYKIKIQINQIIKLYLLFKKKKLIFNGNQYFKITIGYIKIQLSQCIMIKILDKRRGQEYSN